MRFRAADPLNSIIARLPFRWLGIKPAAAVVYGGRRSRRRITTVTPVTLEIEGHHMDYDIFLDQGSDASAEDIAVFIDQDLGGHREILDNVAFGHFDTERYYNQLRAVFDRITKKTGYEIVIAKHPHALSDNLERYLADYRVIQGQTAPLIARSRLVIAHNSAAITTAILYKKPLMLIFSKEYIDSSPWNPVCHYPLAEALERPSLFMEDIDRLSDEELFGNLTNGFGPFISNYVSANPDGHEKLWSLIARNLRENNIIGVIADPSNGKKQQAATPTLA